MNNKSKTDKILEDIERELRALKLIEEALHDKREQVIRKHNQKVSKQRNQNNREVFDSKGREINIGDQVRFDTKGGFHATYGKVKRFTKHFVIAEDNRRVEVRRKPKNVTVLSKKEPKKLQDE